MNEQKPVSLFYRQSGYSMGSITFDLVTSESHSFENIVTMHPIENGSPITDHIQNVLRSGTLTGWVSNFSLTRSTFDLDGAEDKAKLGIRVSASDLSELESPKNRCQEAYDAIKALWESKVLLTIVTALEVYENVIFDNVTCSRDGDTGEIQEFDISFMEVRVITLTEKKIQTSVNAGKPTTRDGKQASPKYDAGKVVTK